MWGYYYIRIYIQYSNNLLMLIIVEYFSVDSISCMIIMVLFSEMTTNTHLAYINQMTKHCLAKSKFVFFSILNSVVERMLFEHLRHYSLRNNHS